MLAEIGEGNLQAGFPASPATAAKAALFEELWEDLKAISSTARTIAREEPGFAADFQLGEDSQRGILAAAETFVEALRPAGVAERFIAFDLPENFVSDLETDLAAIRGKAGEQTDDYLGATGETARTRALIAEGRELLKRLETSVRNRFRRNPEVLAQWRAAARVHRAARPGAEPVPVPVPVPLPPSATETPVAALPASPGTPPSA